MTDRIRPLFFLLLACCCLAPLGAEEQDELAPLIKAVETGANEEAAMALMRRANELERPYAAFVAVKGFLTRTPRVGGAVLIAAADTARLAGEFEQAANYLRRYLGDVQPSAESEARTADFYDLTINLLQNQNAAYQHMLKTQFRFRGQDSGVQRYDAWFLSQARQRRDLENLAFALQKMSESSPTPGQVHEFMLPVFLQGVRSLRFARGDQQPAAEAFARLIGVIPLSAQHQAAANLSLATFAYRRALDQKDDGALAKLRGDLLAAGAAFIAAAKTAESVVETVEALAIGADAKSWDRGHWDPVRATVLPVLAKSIASLEGDELQRALAWRVERAPRALGLELGSVADWVKAGVTRPEVLGQPLSGFADLFDAKGDFAKQFEIYRKAAAPAGSDLAAVMASLDAGKDLAAVAERYFGKESWYRDPGDCWQLWQGLIEPAFRHRAAGADPKAQEAAVSAAVWMAAVGRPWLVRSPMLADVPDAARIYVTQAWYSAGDDQKGEILPHLEAIMWVPFEHRSVRENSQGLRDVGNLYGNWRNQLQKAMRDRATPEAQKEVIKQQLAKAEPVGLALDKLKNGRQVDPAKAPDALCRAFAQLRMVREDAPAAEAAIKELAGQLTGYAQRQIPFAQIFLRQALAPVGRGAPVTEAQAAVLTVVVDGWSTTPPAGNCIRSLLDGCVTSRNRWPDQIAKEERDSALRFNQAVGSLLKKQIAAKVPDRRVFDLFVWTRRGKGWHDQRAGEEVLAQAIEADVMGVLYPGVNQSAVAETMRLVLREFPGLKDRFPVASSFDARFIAEAQAKRYVDPGYWDNGGVDAEGAVARAAAGILAAYERTPIVAGAAGYRYRPADLAKVSYQVFIVSRAKLPPEALVALTARFGQRYGYLVNGDAFFQTNPQLADAEQRKTFFTDLDQWIGRMRMAPYISSHPAMGALGGINPGQLTAEEADVLVKLLVTVPGDAWVFNNGSTELCRTVVGALLKQQRYRDLMRVAPTLWRCADVLRDREIYALLTATVNDVFKQQHTETAASLALAGLELARKGMEDDVYRSLEAIARNARVQFAGAEIPVAKNDPNYPLYLAQQQYQAGIKKGAWATYRDPTRPMESQHVPLLSKLTPEFTLWVVYEHIDRGNFDEAETLLQAALTWLDNPAISAHVPGDMRASFALAWADLSSVRKDYAGARAKYLAIVENQDYDDVRPQILAKLRMADMDRRLRAYDKAEALLQKMEQSPDVWTEARAKYYLAYIKVDNEDFDEAAKLLEESIELDPDNLEANVFLGEVNLKRQRIKAGTDIELTHGALRDRILPGKQLRIKLKDKNRQLAGRASSIELRVWTEKTLDEEFVMLSQIGDDQELFEGSIDTIMASTEKGDRLLQVLGNDRIRFDFSDRFKQQTNYTGASQEQTLMVLSDADLYASSGAIKTKEELATEELQRKLLEANRIQLQKQAGGDVGKLSEVRPSGEVRPGNAFTVKVVDPDMNYTGDIDKVAITVETSSGDKIASGFLLESDPRSGEFGGTVQTAKRSAYAVASDTGDGDPNAVISPGEQLTAWVGSSTHLGPRTFLIDLNDRVELGRMNLVSGFGRRDADNRELPFAGGIKRMIVQTSLNNRSFNTVGTWPGSFAPWQGDLQVDLIPLKDGMPASYEEIITLFDVHYLDETSGRKRLVPKSGTASLRWADDLAGVWKDVAAQLAVPQPKDHQNPRDKKRGGGGDAGGQVGIRLRAAFWVGERTNRTFFVVNNLVGADRKTTIGLAPVLYIDGTLVAPPNAGRRGTVDQAAVLQGRSAVLKKGVHILEIFYGVPPAGGEVADLTLKVKTDAPPYTAELTPDAWDLSQVPPSLKSFTAEPAAINADKATRDLAVDFAGRQARSVRFWIMDHDGDAPQIRKVTLQNHAGEPVLPLKTDYTELQTNDVLEIAPGDSIVITYTDPHPFDAERIRHQVRLSSTYYDGVVTAAFPTYGKGSEVSYDAVRRFEYGDKVKVFIKDNDLDASDAEDKVVISIRTSENRRTTVEAVETGAHTGVFEATFFPVKDAAGDRAGELQVRPGDDVTFTYLDEENTDPGIPWERDAEIEQVVWVDPSFRVYGTASEALPADEVTAMRKARADGESGRGGAAVGAEGIVPQYRLIIKRPEVGVVPGAAPAPVGVVLGGPLVVEIEWPTRCKSTASKLELFAQTKRGREARAAKGGAADPEVFDPLVPGTIMLAAGPGSPGANRTTLPPGYLESLLIGTDLLGDPMNEGRFCFSVPMELGDCPAVPLHGKDAADLRPEDQRLFVTADDEIYLGFHYKDADGTSHWFQQTVKFQGDAIFDCMDKDYREQVAERYVGEKVFLRVVDALKDTGADKDEVAVQVSVASGFTGTMPVMETMKHSGVFTGMVEFTHRRDADAVNNVLNAVPVDYGDVVTLTYEGPGGPLTRTVVINKGSDGEVVTFTKRFRDPDIAMRTVFSIAEAYFEMAKQHRALAEDAAQRKQPKEQESLERMARLEIAEGAKLLNEAIRDFPENAIRAQADYLRAELELELANDTENPKIKEDHYREALRLFGGIVSEYGDTEYGPKALFKKAMVYEKMGDMELASAEYVKLAYTYPNHELIADTIARLGGYYFGEGTKLMEAVKAEEEQIAKLKLLTRAREHYATAGRVYSKLAEKFPSHELAAQSTCAAGQAMMWGHQFKEGVELLKRVAEDTNLQEPETRAEAFYWLTYAHILWQEEGGAKVTTEWDPAVEAYIAANRLLMEFPSTEWAKRVRGLMLKSDKIRDPNAKR